MVALGKKKRKKGVRPRSLRRHVVALGKKERKKRVEKLDGISSESHLAINNIFLIAK